MSFKYVSFQVKMKQLTFHVPVMFPDKLVHASVAAAMLAVLKEHFPTAKIKPVHAGTIGSLFVEAVHGRSETLDLISDGIHDERMINAYDYTHGLKT